MANNEYGLPNPEGYEAEKQAYLQSLENEKLQAEEAEKNGQRIIDIAIDSINNGNKEQAIKMLESLRNTISTQKIVYLDTIDELRDTKLQGASLFESNNN